MRNGRVLFRCLPACAELRPLLAALAAAALVTGGCNLLVESQLSDKPEDAGGAGGLGGFGGYEGSSKEDGGSASVGTASSSSASAGSSASSGGSVSNSSSSGSSVSSSGSGSVSSSSGGSEPTCPRDRADCDEDPDNGCEVHLKNDEDNCGWCGHECLAGDHCSNGECR